MNELEQCVECGLCSRDCLLLKELGVSPKQLAARGIGATEAFSCALCGVCEAACPMKLSPKEMFAEGRRQAVASGEMDLSEQNCLMPDRPHNLMRTYREYYGIDYSDIVVQGRAESCFFPGCTLMTYAPELTRAVYHRLKQSCGCKGMLEECCSKPLSLMGLPDRADQAVTGLVEKLKEHGVAELIVACPGCYYELRKSLAASGIRLRTVYEALPPVQGAPADMRRYTVHDSCPDRTEGIFGRQVRAFLDWKKLALTEMAHFGADGLCCGSGGMISRFRPDLTEQMVAQRMAEAKAAGADVLLGYCMSCVAKFADAPGDFTVRHVLSLLLDRDDDFSGVRAKATQMFEGPQGSELWAKMQSD